MAAENFDLSGEQLEAIAAEVKERIGYAKPTTTRTKKSRILKALQLVCARQVRATTRIRMIRP